MSDGYTYRLPIAVPVDGEMLNDQASVQAWLVAHQPPANARVIDQAARKAAAEQAQSAALAEWEQLRARIPETQEGLTLRALLDEHKPYLDGSLAHVKGLACEHCDQIGGWEREGVEWECANYAIIKEGMG